MSWLLFKPVSTTSVTEAEAVEVGAEVVVEAVEASFNQDRDNRKDNNNSSNHLQATITNADIV